MKRQLVLWGLVGSLALNIFFLVGYFEAQRSLNRAQSPRTSREVLLERLHLRPDQQELFDQLGSEMRRAQAEMSATSAPLFRELWAELAQEEPNLGRLESILERLSSSRLAYSRTALRAGVQLLSDLDDNQRKVFHRALRRLDGLGLRSGLPPVSQAPEEPASEP